MRSIFKIFTGSALKHPINTSGFSHRNKSLFFHKQTYLASSFAFLPALSSKLMLSSVILSAKTIRK